jgi:hypothetical protein
MLGAVVVDGTDWNVRMPRLPKLPPMRASAVFMAAIEKTVSSAANNPTRRTDRRAFIEQTSQGIKCVLYGEPGNDFEMPGAPSRKKFAQYCLPQRLAPQQQADTVAGWPLDLRRQGPIGR